MREDPTISLLYIDDEENNLVGFKATFRRYFQVYTALSAEEGKKILEQHEIPILITDQRMPGMLGTELLADAVKQYPNQMRILLTGYADIESLADAVNRGQIFHYVQKPWDEEYLRKVIEYAFEIYLAKKNNLDEKEMLLTANQQLEFMLRQKLLS